jgi:hypothetical protein
LRIVATREKRTAVVSGFSCTPTLSPHESASARAAGTTPGRRRTTTVVGKPQRTTNLAAHWSAELVATGGSRSYTVEILASPQRPLVARATDPRGIRRIASLRSLASQTNPSGGQRGFFRAPLKSPRSAARARHLLIGLAAPLKSPRSAARPRHLRTGGSPRATARSSAVRHTAPPHQTQGSGSILWPRITADPELVKKVADRCPEGFKRDAAKSSRQWAISGWYRNICTVASRSPAASQLPAPGSHNARNRTGQRGAATAPA